VAPNTSPRIAYKSIVMPQYCVSMHYHECSEFVDPSTAEGRGARRPVGVVNLSYGVSQHYRSCFTSHNRDLCNKLQDNYTILDDTVLRYRQQLMANVHLVLNTGTFPHDNVTVIHGNATAA